MPYITSIERLGREEGRLEGREEGRLEGRRAALRTLLELRFGAVPATLAARIDTAADAELTALYARAVRAQRIDDL